MSLLSVLINTRIIIITINKPTNSNNNSADILALWMPPMSTRAPWQDPPTRHKTISSVRFCQYLKIEKKIWINKRYQYLTQRRSQDEESFLADLNDLSMLETLLLELKDYSSTHFVFSFKMYPIFQYKLNQITYQFVPIHES